MLCTSPILDNHLFNIKLSSSNLFNENFIKEKDLALQPIELFFERINENEDETLSIKNDKNEKSNNYYSNIILVDSESENSSQLTIMEQIEKEIEKINNIRK